MSDELTDYQRGLKEGAVDALLQEHTARLNKINGSVERHAKSNEALTREMRAGFEKLAGEIRTMQEEARLDRERVKVTASTLAAETERLRSQKASAFNRRDRIWAAVVSTLLLVVSVLTLGPDLYH